MTQLNAAERGLDYAPYEFGSAPLTLRGPQKTPEGDYIAMLGGSETYGKYVQYPFPDLVEAVTGVPVMNLGVMSAGVGAFCEDAAVAEICKRSKATVVQVLGAQNMSNPLYSVHARRNDRLLGATPALKSLYKGLDLTEVHFTRHLMNKLKRLNEDCFAEVREVLRDAWVANMRALLGRIDSEVVLLWISTRAPQEPENLSDPMDPLFVDRRMLVALRDHFHTFVEIRLLQEPPDKKLFGKIYAASEAEAAVQMPGPRAHGQIAQTIATALQPILRANAGITTEVDESALFRSGRLT
ncbi:MAG: DUF6473 family protein [Pseudomonadota bacterium]